MYELNEPNKPIGLEADAPAEASWLAESYLISAGAYEQRNLRPYFCNNPAVEIL